MKKIKLTNYSPLLLVSGISLMFGVSFLFYPYNIFEKKPNTAVKSIRVTKHIATPTTTPAPTTEQMPMQPVQSQQQTVIQTPTAQPITQATTTPQPTSSAGSTQTAQTFQVHLTINGSAVGSVDMQEGNNQCDVLSRAKDQGKISSLLMRYDNSLGTNAVYQINGIGKDNSVWWVYKVNGQSPNQGCSFIKAASGDNVEWEYKG